MIEFDNSQDASVNAKRVLKPMFSESEKQEKLRDMLDLSGEFFVVGELLRRNIPAAITYGDTKNCDVIARNGRKIMSITIKVTRDGKWSIRRIESGASSLPDDSIVVFVNLPRDRSAPPEFFVLSGADVRAVFKSAEGPIMANGLPRRDPINCDDIQSHNGSWDKITTALGLPKGDWN